MQRVGEPTALKRKQPGVNTEGSGRPLKRAIVRTLARGTLVYVGVYWS